MGKASRRKRARRPDSSVEVTVAVVPDGVTEVERSFSGADWRLIERARAQHRVRELLAHFDFAGVDALLAELRGVRR
jgi:hypothetical protein